MGGIRLSLEFRAILKVNLYKIELKGKLLIINERIMLKKPHESDT